MTQRQRGIGDFLMHMYIAQGLGEFAIDFGLKPWDLAPLGLIVEEAGGILTDSKGQDTIYSGTQILGMDDFRHHPWMDNDTCNIKFAVLYYIYNDWIDFTILWKAVS